MAQLALSPPRHTDAHAPGALRLNIGKHGLGLYDLFDYYRCSGCGTDYPVINGVIRCNGFTITDCPWCGTHSTRAAEVRR